MSAIESKNALGFGTAITMVAAVIGILVWLGLSPTQQITRAEVEAKIEKLETSASHDSDIAHIRELYSTQDKKLDLILERLPRRR